jgi:hypothetical protein
MRRTRLVFGSLALVLALPIAGIGQIKPKDIQAIVTFRNAPGDMIWGDAVGARIDAIGGRLGLSDDANTGHRLHVSFDVPTAPAPSPLNCGTWASSSYTWYMAPAFDLSTPSIIQIVTMYQVDYDSRGAWVVKWNPPPKKGSATQHYLDLRNDVPPGQTRYVQMMIRLYVYSSNDMYDVLMNEAWPQSDYGGIFEIEAGEFNAPAPGAAGDTFTIRPLVPWQPYPLPGLGQNEALLLMTDHADYRGDVSGPCNMGNFSMPFEMYVTRK